MNEEFKNKLIELCDNMDVNPFKLNQIVSNIYQEYLATKRMEQIARNEAYVGRFFRYTDEVGETCYCKVIDSRSDTSGEMSCLVIPTVVDQWGEETCTGNIWYGYAKIDVMSVSHRMLDDGEEISGKEFDRLAHEYLDKVLALNWRDAKRPSLDFD